MRKLFAAAAVIAALGAGTFALSMVLPAGAQTPSTSSSGAAGSGPGGRIKSVLDGLVKDGTINQGQEDKILAALKAAAPEGGKRHGRFGKGFGGGFLGDITQTTANALGMSVSDLKSQLQSGKTIADIASAKGVSLDTVTKALTDAATQRIDQAVAAGKLTQAQADKLKTNLPTLIDKLEHSLRAGCGRGHHGQPGSSSSDSSGSRSSNSVS